MNIIELANWKQIPSFPDYEVSDCGHVKRGERLIAQSKNGGGYPRVTIQKYRKAVSRVVHALVAEAFIGTRPNGFHVCHIDGNKENNNVSNLRYATPSENAMDKHAHGKASVGDRNGMRIHPEKRPVGSKHGCAILNEEMVLQIKHRLKHGYHGICAEPAREYGVSVSTISCIQKGKTWRHV